MIKQSATRSAIGIMVSAAVISSSAVAEKLSPIRTSDFDLLSAHAERTLDTLSEVDATLGARLRDAMESAVDPEWLPSQKAEAVQRVLDDGCLLVVSINPESRVKVSAGPAQRDLQPGRWRTYLVKVHNLAAVMSPLRVLTEQDAGDTRDRWLEIELCRSEAVREELSGDLIEYRVLRVRTTHTGFRAAVIAMDVGQGTADIGFRNDILVTFRCEDPK